MPFTLELIVSWGTHPWYHGRLWLPEPEWTPVGLQGNQIFFFSQDGTQNLGHNFETCSLAFWCSGFPIQSVSSNTLTLHPFLSLFLCFCWYLISSRKLEIPRDHFMQRWARKRTEIVWTLQKQKILRRGGSNTQKNCTKRSSWLR